MVFWLLLATGAVALAGTLMPLVPHKAWWVRIWDFPRPQLMAMAALAGGGLVVAGHGRSLAGLLAAIVFAAAALRQAWRILPYTPLWRRQMARSRSADPARGLSLLVVNVLMTNRRIDGLLRSLARCDPDIVLALETDRWWVEQLEAALPEHRHRLLDPRDNTYGLALLSRLELVEPELRHLISAEIPSVRTGVRLRSGETLRLYALHPEPPSPTEADSSLERDAELILIGREVAAAEGPVIVGGDLNDVAWSHTSRLFRRLSGLLDPRIGRGLYSTFNAHWPLLRWPLDHVFASPDLVLRRIDRLPAFGSDHFPICVSFALAARAPDHDPPPPADGEDHREARETLREAGATPPARG